ncbi:MAG: GNAT family N-acetyltransferase [Planctomycetota bacterium]|nr:GNAT family N-acetyltransferase [Planctomycetota bacterium]MDA1138609.1 GNAT family N-acetyltransferase [Planctomycetota bacterium]
MKHPPPASLFDSVELGVEKNFDEWQKLRGQMADVRLHALEDATCLVSNFIGGPNDVTLPRFAPEGAAARVDELLRLFKENDFAVRFWVGPACTPGLKSVLRKKAIRCTSNLAGMAISLERDFRADPPTGCELERLTDFSVFEEVPHPVLGKVRSQPARRNLEEMVFLQEAFPDQVYHLAARSGKYVAGSATLFMGSDSAGIYDVAVLPRFRRLGIGTAITEQICGYAQRMGYLKAVLIASKEGRNLYARFGFHDAGTISVCVLSKAQRCRDALLYGRFYK